MSNDQSKADKAVKVPLFIGLKPLQGRYYAAECQRCGWVGSSAECTDDAQCTRIHCDRMCLGETEEVGADHLLGIIQAMTKSTEQREVALAIPDECPHLILFDDAQVEQLIFAGAGARAAALRKWEAISTSWNAHLFVRIGRNSRDDGYPCARVEQHQGEPVNLPACKLVREHNSHDWDEGYRDGWGGCLDEIAKLGPLYTHADPNVRWKAVADEQMKVIEGLRAQLAERDALLHRWVGNFGHLGGCATPLRDETKAALSASAEPSAAPVTIPDGYCIMPKRLTAENGGKVLLLGEFKLEVTHECPECLELDEPAEGCEICDGEGEYGQRHTIPWDKIKFIYSKAVKGLALKSQPSGGVSQMTFEYVHADGERRTVSVSRAEVAEHMDSELFDKLTETICQCETVGETNVLDCRCDEVAEQFERVPEPSVAGKQEKQS